MPADGTFPVPALPTTPAPCPQMAAGLLFSEHTLRRSKCVRVARAAQRARRSGGTVTLFGGTYESASAEVARILSFVVNHGVALDVGPEEQARALGLIAMARSVALDTIEAEHDPRWMRRSAEAVELLERVVDDRRESAVVRWAARVAMLAFIECGSIIGETGAHWIVESTVRFLGRNAVRPLLNAATGGISYDEDLGAWMDGPYERVEYEAERARLDAA